MNEKRKFTITNFELGSQDEVEAYFIKKISKNDLKDEMNIFKIYDTIQPIIEEDNNGIDDYIYLTQSDMIKYENFIKFFKNKLYVVGSDIITQINKIEKIKVVAKINSEKFKEYVETLIKEDDRYEVVMYNINDKYKDIELTPVNEVVDKLFKKI